MTASMDSSVDIKHYVRMFWRRRALVILCAAVVASATYVTLDFVPMEFESEATLVIEERQRLASELESVLGGMRPPSSGYRSDEKRMDKLVSRVRSRPFLEKVVRLLKMNEDPAVLAQAEQALQKRPGLSLEEMATRIVVHRLQKKISFARAGSGIYKIIVTDTDPNNAQLLAKWISELFVDVSQQNSLDELRTAHAFGAQQLKIYEEQLATSERALEQYRKSMIQQNLSKSIVRAGNVARAEALYERVLDEAELTRVRILPYTRTLEETGALAMGNELLTEARILNQARGLTSALEDEITDRLVSETGQSNEWPPSGSYVSLRRGLFQLIERITSERYADLPGATRDAISRYVFSTMDHRAHADAAEYLGQAISDFKRQAQAEPRDEMELARLESTVKTNRELLRSFQAQLVASDVSQAMEMTNLGLRIEILEPPEVPLGPARPNRRRILIAALLMGPVLGLGVAFAAELLDPTLRSLGDFQRVFDGPILGTTPLLSGAARPDATFWRRNGLWVAIAIVVVLTLGYRALKPLWHDPGRITPVYLVDPEEAQQP